MEVIQPMIMEEESLVRRRGHSSTATNGDENVNKLPLKDKENEGDASGQPPPENYVNAEDLTAILQNVEIGNAMTAIANDETVKNMHAKFLSEGFMTSVISGKSQGENSNSQSRGKNKGESEHIKFDIEGEVDEEVEEEIIELEFDKEIQHTHNIYCPKCSSQITKVTLRRRRVRKQIPTPTTSEGGLFGCLSCFSVFMPKGNSLRPFKLWSTDDTIEAPKQPLIASEKGEGVNCFGIFCAGGETPKHPNPEDGHETTPTLPRDIIIPIDPSCGLVGNRRPEISRISEKPDIIKSIVYGGLTESIASLSVVSSAAASHASTLNIVALGLANLIGGLFVLAQNLWDLKNGHQVDTYQELLGRKKHFLLHATLAILSYLVFGLVPPVVYGFTFRETDDRDFKLLAVAASSFVCIFLLAIGKAYILCGREHKFTKYLKTITYFITTAALASGVGFAVGDLANKFMEQVGWFEPNQAGNLFFDGSNAQRSAFASY